MTLLDIYGIIYRRYLLFDIYYDIYGINFKIFIRYIILYIKI